tara:strand:- start:687 stop:1448 length:762 start_codon:yes stop_codon:yes gene_type:complete
MYYSNKLSKYNSISHCFLGRKGGSSKRIYKSLNCGKGSLDNKNDLNKNLRIACKKIGSSYKKLILLNQIHSNKFYFFDKKNVNHKNRKLGDALITKEKKIIIGILTADCVPILIYDKKLKVISAIHAGWKGAYKGIVNKVIKYLFRNGSEPKNIIAAIGPCINQKNYEVKKDFMTKFLKQSEKNEIFFKKIKKKTYFSLNKYVYTQLRNLGLRKIDIIEKDTYNPKNNLFSARRSLRLNHDDYGRNISIIMIN